MTLELSDIDQCSRPTPALRVLLVAEYCSCRGGGEGVIAYHYFRLLRARGIDAYLLTHGRCQAELEAAFPDDRARLFFVRDSIVHRGLFACGRWLPDRVNRATFGFVSLMYTQWRQRRVARRLVAEKQIDVVHQPTPVSPAQPTLIYDVGAPVVIGPLNGGINYPPGFWHRENRWERWAANLGRRLRHLVNRWVAGKREAALVLVSNARTRQMLPAGLRGEVVELIENGVDLQCWPKPPARLPGPLQFAFLGRLVDWKGIDLLLEAWARIHEKFDARLKIIGDGPLRGALEVLCQRLGIAESVQFVGWLDQRQCWEQLCGTDVLVLPALLECGGACVLEAMAAEVAVVATAWGGPVDYLDPSCGILVSPTSHEEFVAGLAAAMEQLAASPERCAEMGRAGRAKVEQHFDWELKVDTMLKHYVHLTNLPIEPPIEDVHRQPPAYVSAAR